MRGIDAIGAIAVLLLIALFIFAPPINQPEREPSVQIVQTLIEGCDVKSVHPTTGEAEGWLICSYCPKEAIHAIMVNDTIRLFPKAEADTTTVTGSSG